jgi:tetratricopeptide (TPR) repeat protein
MRLPHEAHRSSVYLNFKEIDDRAFQTIVRFFEENESDIQLLRFDEYLEVLLAYTAALFEVGAYSNYIAVCDYAIESVIYFNIEQYGGEDIYAKLLFRKAASFYHLMEYKKSEKILRELIRINPDDKLTAAFLRKCLRAQATDLVRKTRIVSVLFFLIAAMIIAVEIFAIETLFPSQLKATQYLRNTIFGTGWLFLGSGVVYLHFSVYKKVRQELNVIKKEKTNVDRKRQSATGQFHF